MVRSKAKGPGPIGESGLWLKGLNLRVGIIAKFAGPLEESGDMAT